MTANSVERSRSPAVDRWRLICDAPDAVLTDGASNMARDEAIVRNRPIAFEADEHGYRFLIREENVWQLLDQDELLRARQFERPPVAVAISPSVPQPVLRVVFGREPVDKPFVLTLAAGDSSVTIKADGIGHFVVN